MVAWWERPGLEGGVWSPILEVGMCVESMPLHLLIFIRTANYSLDKSSKSLVDQRYVGLFFETIFILVDSTKRNN